MDQRRVQQIYLNKAQAEGYGSAIRGGLTIGGARPRKTARRCAYEGKLTSASRKRCFAYYRNPPADYVRAYPVGILSEQPNNDLFQEIANFRTDERAAARKAYRERKMAEKEIANIPFLPGPSGRGGLVIGGRRKYGGRHCIQESRGPSGKLRCHKYGGDMNNREAAARSPWIKFVKKWAKENNMSYSMALRDHGAEVSAAYRGM